MSFRIDLFDLLAVQGTRKTLLQHHSSKASILQCSALFMANAHIHAWLLEKPWLWLNGPLWAKWYVCFLIHCLRFAIAILPRSKSLLISWLQSLSALILEPKKMKSDAVFTFSPFICYEVIWPDAMILLFWMLSSKPAFILSFSFIKRLYNVYFSNWSTWFFKVWMWSIK